MRSTRSERDHELIPGTELMADSEGHHFVHNANAPNSSVLVPQPSSDPHDPLNWSSKWKNLVLLNQGLFVICSNITGLSLAPLTPILMEQWGKTPTQVALLTGVTVITLGYSNFIIIPFADLFGRRITVLICSLISLASCIWQASANSYGSFLGARVLIGTGAAANESIMNVVVADIIFLHERGRFVGTYFWCYFFSLFLGPIISGAVTQRTTYRWFFWACAIFQGLNTIGLFFFCPETRRLGFDDKPAAANQAALESSASSAEKGVSTGTPKSEEGVDVEQVDDIPIDPYLGKGKPSRAQFGVFQPIDRSALRFLLRHFVTPVQIFFFPIIFWASMTLGGAANSLLAVNIMQSSALAAPPYNFTPAQVGYANFALVGGGMIGLLVAGPWSDIISAKATKKNGGVREPEMRLISLIPFALSAVIGMVVFGVGVQYAWPWPAVVIIGFGFVGLQVVSIPTIAITYAIDSYKPIAGEIMVIGTVCKNTFGFGMTYFMPDWAAKDGFIPPIMLLMAITAGFSLIGMAIFIVYGKQFRRWTRNSKVHDL